MNAEIAWDLRSPDVGPIIGRVGGLLRPFRLRTDPGRHYDARLFGRQFAHTGMLIIDYGQEVTVEADPMRSFSLIQIPLSGTFELRGTDGTRVVGAQEAHVLGPMHRLNMRWSPDCRLLVVRLDESATRRLMARCQARNPEFGRDSESGAILRLDDGPGQSLFRMLCLLRDEALCDGSLSRSPAHLGPMEDLMLQLLAQSLEDQFQPRPGAGRHEPGGPGPVVERAEAYMVANLGRRITSNEIAAACGVSRRTLFDAFRNGVQTTPKAWLTELRLRRVREELCDRDCAGRTVTGSALNWGFNHLGRFAALYRARFGENPSETLTRH